MVLRVTDACEGAHCVDAYTHVRIIERRMQWAPGFRHRQVAQRLTGPATHERLLPVKRVYQHRHRSGSRVDQTTGSVVALAPVPGTQIPAKNIHSRFRTERHDRGKRSRAHRPAENLTLAKPDRRLDDPLQETSCLPFCFSNRPLQHGEGLTTVHQSDQRFSARVLSGARQQPHQRCDADLAAPFQGRTSRSAHLHATFISQLRDLLRCGFTTLPDVLLEGPDLVEFSPSTPWATPILLPLSFPASKFEKQRESALSAAHQHVRRCFAHIPVPFPGQPLHDAQHLRVVHAGLLGSKVCLQGEPAHVGVIVLQGHLKRPVR